MSDSTNEPIEELAARLKDAVLVEDAGEVVGKPTPEKKRAKKAPVEEAAVTVSGDELAPIFVTAGALAASRFVGVAPVSEEEARELGKAWAPIVEKYGGAALSQHSELLAAAVVTLKVVVPRVYAHKAAAAQLSSGGQLELMDNERESRA